ncbi:hypothetical protein HMPREF0837_10028 [Streptococcus pneumoniae TCH8431/19A]|nr:hypothetical protein HMPREF0837_10028 [Streptococcus pneumoniae TCH8431/19A]
MIFIESKVGVEVILKDFLEIALDIYIYGKIKRIAVISIDLGDFLIWYWIRQVVIYFNI